MSTATIIDGISATFPVTEDIEAYRLTALQTDGSVIGAVLSDDAETRVGFTTRAATDGEETPIRLLNGGGTVFATVGTTVANAGIALYGAADGKLSTVDTSAGSIIGYSRQSAAVDDVIEVILA